jgi:hypothetical protein
MGRSARDRTAEIVYMIEWTAEIVERQQAIFTVLISSRDNARFSDLWVSRGCLLCPLCCACAGAMDSG